MLPKKPIPIGFFRMWTPAMGPDLFFKFMPYIRKRFNLVRSNCPRFMFSQNSFPGGVFIKIYYNYENRRPDTKNSDWSFGADYEDQVNHPRYFRQPNYVRLGAGENIVKHHIDVNAILGQKTKFCNFLYCHDTALRSEFFKLLSKYKKIDSPGNSCSNMKPIGEFSTGWQARQGAGLYELKLEFLKPYKFTIAFEHSSYPGYTSEKIYHPMLVNSIPIYWGNPLVQRDFNQNSFVSAHTKSYSNLSRMLNDLVDRVIAIDKDDSLYAKMLQEPWYPNNVVNQWANKENIIKQFERIFGV